MNKIFIVKLQVKIDVISGVKKIAYVRKVITMDMIIIATKIKQRKKKNVKQIIMIIHVRSTQAEDITFYCENQIITVHHDQINNI
jgi:uncharacterized protein YeaC (DUF1315 family)